MPASKYERELRFIHDQIARLEAQYRALGQTVPADPAAAEARAEEAQGIQVEIASLMARKKEIEKSFVEAGMDIPDINRSMNATVHNAGAFEIRGEEEAERVAGIAPVKGVGSDDVAADIRKIGEELADVEDRMIRAEIEGDEEEHQKLSMMASSLRSRRETLVRRAKEMREAENNAPAAAPADDAVNGRIQALEEDCRALRSQVMDVRTGLQDVKEQLRQILIALGIEPE